MKTVVIGMSGGVDSSVAAYLLKQEGYQVIGLFMRNWDTSVNNDILGNPTLGEEICTQEQDYNDAVMVCKKLEIPLHRIDFIKEYWDYVFTYFLDEIKKGRTPNPDIMCNKYIKFDMFVKEALKLGADSIATGHYANTKDGLLYRAKDLNKDQTYFLSQVTKKQLEHVMFPLGEIDKPTVRKIALELGLSTAEKKDSTGICFIGERNFKDFLKNYISEAPGEIINIETNEVIGKHHGVMYYTIGQRKDLGIGGSTDKIYVVGKDASKNILYVAYGDENEYLLSDEALIEQVNFISENRPIKATAKFRYRQPDQEVTIEYLDNNEIIVHYNNVKAVTPGQACVLYDGDVCLGGGIIKEVRKNSKKLWYL